MIKHCCPSSSNQPIDIRSKNIAFVGNPSVGKSAFFSRITGIGVIVSNYPGTTVEITQGSVQIGNRVVNVVDLPGIYSLGAATEDEKVSKRYLLKEKPDVIVNVVDATRLERNLFLTLQVLELGIPTVVALNQVDAAREMGIEIDSKKLSELLGVPVIPTIATKGIGLDEVMKKAVDPSLSSVGRIHVHYDNHIRYAVEDLGAKFPDVDEVTILRALEGDVEFIELMCEKKVAEYLFNEASTIAKKIEQVHGIPVSDTIARDLYGEAGQIARIVASQHEVESKLKCRIDSILTSEYVGIFGLVMALLLTFFVVFRGGGFLEEGIVYLFETYLIEPVRLMMADSNPVIRNVVIYSLIGIEAGFAIAIPYIGIFYIILSLFEDSGYLSRASYIVDHLTHYLGLHGRSVIPLVLGFGCSVPAIMATRSLNTMRERRIASLLISLIPCSARTVIILGLVGTFVGFWAAVSIYVLETVIILSVGWMLGRALPGEHSGLIMEISPLRKPDAVATLKKTWIRISEFIYVAFPLLIVGSAILGALEVTGVLDTFDDFVSPVSVGLLGLPAFAATALVFGILRKEMALEILAVLAGTANFLLIMTPLQMYVFAVITTIYMPCVATIAILKHELGSRDTVAISTFTIVLAFTVGAIINYVAKYWGGII
ncbi:ferrous iron transport protein B [Methanohalophilus sp.]|uniref:ferrous iron transport protein B n=1 Tax=Methanohalophilus sp. TaxID=1966352 RepID=UPI002611B3C9|nr:ferrous iron transport protein B [Methanohalophilus sp.]MDK2892994.1 ferrous iron transport protein [Methanohalophilus sp.]